MTGEMAAIGCLYVIAGMGDKNLIGPPRSRLNYAWKGQGVASHLNARESGASPSRASASDSQLVPVLFP